MMTDRLDGILKQALAPDEEPEEEINQEILRRIKEDESMIRQKHIRRIPAAALIAAFTMCVGSLTAFAAVKFLTPAQVTQSMGDEKLAKVFSEEGIYVGEKQSFGGYDVTFIGIASGRNISDRAFFTDGNLREDRSYTVVSIACSDGASMSDTPADEYDISDFFVTPLIQGCDPVWCNAATMSAGAMEMVVDGVRYRLTECDNIEIFADREIYLGVMDSMCYNNAAYSYDEASGKITRREGYAGLNALFSVPIDRAKADPDAASAYLEQLRKSVFGADEPDDADGPLPGDKLSEEAEYEAYMIEIWGDQYEEMRAIEQWYASLTPENIDEYAVPVESTRKILVPDQDGYISDWNFEVEGRGGGEGGKTKAEWLFRTVDADQPMVLNGYVCRSEGMDSIMVRTFTQNADGTITFVIYVPKER